MSEFTCFGCNENLHARYQKLVSFVRELEKRGCDIFDSGNCRSCAANDLLKEIEEV